MCTPIKEQVERIVDEHQGKERLDVIVEFGAPDSETERLLSATIEGLKARRVFMSPREMVPIQKDLIEKAREYESKRQAGKRSKRPSAELEAAGGNITTIYARLASVLQSIGDGSFSYADILDKGATLIREFGGQHIESIKLASSVGAYVDKDGLARLAESDLVRGVFVNREISHPIVTNSPDPNELSLKEKHGVAWGIEKTNALAARERFGARGRGVKVAVLDTGVDSEHPDLKGKVALSAEFDGTGKALNEKDGTSRDTAKHGTHCAGIIVGESHEGRCIGMAPEATLLSATVIPRGRGSHKQILAGMDWAVENGADIISMSLGGLNLNPQTLDTYTRALINANFRGIPVVVAAGNDGHQTTGAPGDHALAFTVGATNYHDVVAGFSGGRTHILEQSEILPSESLPLVYIKPDVVAPGVAICSSVPGGKYESWNGTSMAVPHVAGAFALMLSATSLVDEQGPGRYQLLQEFLAGTVEELGEKGQDQRYGFGRIDVLRAICYAIDRGYVRKPKQEQD